MSHSMEKFETCERCGKRAARIFKRSERKSQSRHKYWCRECLNQYRREGRKSIKREQNQKIAKDILKGLK